MLDDNSINNNDNNSQLNIVSLLSKLTISQTNLENSVNKLEKTLFSKINSIDNRVLDQKAQQDRWKGAVGLIGAVSFIFPVIIVGIFSTFNPNNRKIEDLQIAFINHTTDPKLHSNIYKNIELDYVQKSDLEEQVKYILYGMSDEEGFKKAKKKRFKKWQE